MEIEIRGWHVSRKRMFYSGQMVKDQLTLLTDGRFINVNGDNTSLSEIFDNRKQFVPMLYIGMKDLNGKNIFEGDILWYEQESSKGDVWFEGTGFKTDCYGTGIALLNPEVPVEIIGNVYENPEMVEGLIRI
jgi:uncharacterized phage protein (TIGR01671 family)